MQTVLEIRIAEEEKVQVELARMLRERGVVQQQLDQSIAAENDLHAYLKQPQLAASQMEHIARYSEHHRQTILRNRTQLSQIDKAVIQIRERLMVARSKREALEKHKEQCYEDYRQAVESEEQKRIDEVATMRAARKTSRQVRGAA